MHATLRILVWTLALALVLLPVVAMLNGWIGAERWPLRTLRIGGELKRVDAQQLRGIVLPYARNGFFAVRLDEAQAAVATLPWVEHAEVRKRWPDVLEVRIVEYQPFARWGDDRLLSEFGHLFPIGTLTPPPGLPHFDVDAPPTRIKDVVALYNHANELFAAEGRSVRTLALDRRGSWSLTLSSGTEVVIGSQEARLRLLRFARLLPQLITQRPLLPLLRADLRYTNGFALTWALEPGLGTRDSGFGNVNVNGERQSANDAKGAKGANEANSGAAGSPRSAGFTPHPPSLSFALFASFADKGLALRVPSPESRAPTAARVPPASIPHSPLPIPGFQT
ncbi:MAG: cell division protein FtsQ/DivIB [Luteimonas sp.]